MTPIETFEANLREKYARDGIVTLDYAYLVSRADERTTRSMLVSLAKQRHCSHVKTNATH